MEPRVQFIRTYGNLADISLADGGSIHNLSCGLAQTKKPKSGRNSSKLSRTSREKVRKRVTTLNPSMTIWGYYHGKHFIRSSKWEALQTHPLASLISEIFRSLNNVYGFYAAYIYELFMDDDIEIFGTPAENLKACLIELAAAKLNVDPQMAPKFAAFRRDTVELYKNGLTILKDKAFRAGIPLRAELLDMVHSDHEGLGLDAERESLGINSKRLHPDIYMNELLCGMRAIHQVLPAIMKKLEVYEDFQLDTSEFDLKD